MLTDPETISSELLTFEDQRIRVQFTPYGRDYTYLAFGGVGVGDLVEVSPNSYKPTPSIALVVGLGSDYSGPVTPIIRVVRRAGE